MEVQTTQGPIAYVERGQGQPLLLVHGFPLNKEMWAPQLDGLSEQVRVLAPDLRGHGATPSQPGSYSMDSLADDLAAFLDALGIQGPVIVGGLSMGGYVAQAFCRRHPQRLGGLILAATKAGADSPEARSNRDAMAEKARQQGITPIVEAMLPKLLAPQTYLERPELVEQVRGIMQATSVEGAIGALLGMKERPDSHESLKAVQAPALVLAGEADPIAPAADADAMQAALPHSELHIIANAGHLLNLEQPQQFNERVSQFLQRF